MCAMSDVSPLQCDHSELLQILSTQTATCGLGVKEQAYLYHMHPTAHQLHLHQTSSTHDLVLVKEFGNCCEPFI